MGERSASRILALACGETAAALGMQIVLFVVPLAAVELFDANTFELGLLNLVDSVAALCFGFVVGGLIDGVGGVRAVSMADALRFISTALLAIGLVVDPHMWMLYIAMLLVGVGGLIHDAGVTTAVTTIEQLDGRRLNRVNAALRAGSVVSDLIGPGVGGLLVLLVGFGASAAGGSLAFLVAAAVCFGLLRRQRVAQSSSGQRTRNSGGLAGTERTSATAGLRFVWDDDTLRPLTLSSTQFNFFSAGFQAVFLVYCVKVLHFGAGELAVVGIVAGAGALAGAGAASLSIVSRHTRKFYAASLFVPGLAVVAMINAEQILNGSAVVVIALAQAVFSACMVICVVLFNTVRQMRSPSALAGRIAAAERVLALMGEIPGALLGGLIGLVITLNVPLWIAAVGMSLSAWWVFRIRDWDGSPRTDSIPGISNATVS
ncbi:hypothetical protein Csp2054_12260 [Curtobacterium sp. 'Ferrero']|uniref:MFS transporter n=1 Tax=Curtobacterium sp. 'Ferrero' TaxID=2033654 RepID=UPI000BCE2F39|nr:MFS transporter [Curtobacterium sp. 'Ferrero']PCN47431.1 hypothetical protein Csp2054_12260 [Curtobacterium sp. 'Ferrero']